MMSRRCGSSKPTPTSLGGKATKPAKYVNKKLKGTPSLDEAQEEIVNENHRQVTSDGGGEEDA